MARIAKAKRERMEFKASWSKAIQERRAVMFRWPDGTLTGREFLTIEEAQKAVDGFNEWTVKGRANIIVAA